MVLLISETFSVDLELPLPSSSKMKFSRSTFSRRLWIVIP